MVDKINNINMVSKVGYRFKTIGFKEKVFIVTKLLWNPSPVFLNATSFDEYSRTKDIIIK